MAVRAFLVRRIACEAMEWRPSGRAANNLGSGAGRISSGT
jgi:hypothetical protein